MPPLGLVLRFRASSQPATPAITMAATPPTAPPMMGPRFEEGDEEVGGELVPPSWVEAAWVLSLVDWKGEVEIVEVERVDVLEVEAVDLVDVLVCCGTPMVVRTEGVPESFVSLWVGQLMVSGRRTWEEQGALLLRAARQRCRTTVDTHIQVLIRVGALHDAIPAVQEVVLLVDAEERTTRAPPVLVGAGSPYKLAGVGLLSLFTSRLTYAVGETGIALATAERVLRVVPARDVVGCKPFTGEVACGLGWGPEEAQ